MHITITTIMSYLLSQIIKIGDMTVLAFGYNKFLPVWLEEVLVRECQTKLKFPCLSIDLSLLLLSFMFVVTRLLVQRSEALKTTQI